MTRTSKRSKRENTFMTCTVTYSDAHLEELEEREHLRHVRVAQLGARGRPAAVWRNRDHTLLASVVVVVVV